MRNGQFVSVALAVNCAAVSPSSSPWALPLPSPVSPVAVTSYKLTSDAPMETGALVPSPSSCLSCGSSAGWPQTRLWRLACASAQNRNHFSMNTVFSPGISSCPWLHDQDQVPGSTCIHSALLWQPEGRAAWLGTHDTFKPITQQLAHLLTTLCTSVLPSFLGWSGLARGEQIHSWFGRVLSGEMSVNNGSSSRSLSLI